MAVPSDMFTSCLRCEESCKGFRIHKWRNTCESCNCSVDFHDIVDKKFSDCLNQMGLTAHPQYTAYHSAQALARKIGYQWLPLGVKPSQMEKFVRNLPWSHTVEFKAENEHFRTRQFRLQIPFSDRHINFMQHLNSDKERQRARQFLDERNSNSFGIGEVKVQVQEGGQACDMCKKKIVPGELCIQAIRHAGQQVWHPQCFVCQYCNQALVDHFYWWLRGKLFCERHYAQCVYPRCHECDELIFRDEYAINMDQEHHSEHFACKNCDKSLTGQRYILKDEHPYCLQCYEEVYANACDKCKEKIGCDSKDLSFKERHWHEKCFNCSHCNTSLVDHPFAMRDDALFCSDCYDEKFAARCDGCNQVFKAGMRKFEYRGKQWHEECFTCAECRQPIGAKSFIPRDQQVVCVPCYEEKFAQRCTKCKEVIRRGGVTYKGEPWHKECFVCSHCNKQLAGVKFISKDEQPYCAECYGDLFAKKCCKCTKPITGIGGCKFISFEERHWHSECFNCSKCSTNLVGKGFLTTDDQITCPECGR